MDLLPFDAGKRQSEIGQQKIYCVFIEKQAN
jgi:hypothetical protein